MAGTNQVDQATRIDVAQLLEARLWIARLGESDVNNWWRTDGILGPDGAFVGPRVLPMTHPTARARIAFKVASHACDVRHPDPDVYHLFHLDPWTEDRLDALLAERLDDKDYWEAQMSQLEAIKAGAKPDEVLTRAQIITEDDLKLVRGLKLGPAGRSLAIPSDEDPECDIRLLAAGFSRSEPNNLVVPYLDTGK